MESSHALRRQQNPTGRRKSPLFAWQELSQNETSWLVTSQQMKSLEVFVFPSPPNSLLPSIKQFFSSFLLGPCTWLTMIADPKQQLFIYPQ